MLVEDILNEVELVVDVDEGVEDIDVVEGDEAVED